MTSATQLGRLVSGAPAHLLCGVLILALIVWRLGTGPFLHGFRTITAGSLAAAAAIAVVSTVCSAWRWNLVARRLSAGVPMPAAVAAYYRSQFLNTVLPGGVLGDVHRGVRHGRDVGEVGHSLRAVVWERFAGQVVQMGLALVVLTVFPSPVRSSMPIMVPAVVLITIGVVVLMRCLPAGWHSRPACIVRAARDDVRHGLLHGRVWPRVTFASAVVVICHTAMFLLAARTAGSTVSVGRMLPLATLVLLAMTLPTSVGGWGPREGVAAWLFASAGLGAAQGVAIATVYGVLDFAACLPGAAILLVSWLGGVHPRGADPTSAASGSPVVARRTVGV
jgi:uncharacterized membrane protein YbhN (UPF0104 family)